MKALTLDELTLFVPNIWDKPWDESIEDAEGVDREFLRVQAAYARLLQRIAPTPATAEKIGFLSLWSRFFGALAGGRGASEWKSRFAVSVIGRVALESSLHLQAVMLPILEADISDGPDIGEEHWAATRDRLCGYVAWSLRGDELLYERLSRSRTLEEAFDPVPERDFIQQLGPAQEAWERISHQRLELVSDQEASHDLEKAKRRLKQSSQRISTWLSDPRLAPWIAKLKDLENSPNVKGAVTLFQLFGLPPSVSQFLKRRGASIAYIGYLRGSGFIHGSSLEASMLMAGGVVAPDFANLGNGFESATNSVLSDCALARVLLDLLAGHLN